MSLVRQPSPERLLDGIARALSEKILPRLDSDYARAELGTALSLLVYLRDSLDSAVADLVEEIGELEGLLGDAALELDGAGRGDQARRVRERVAARCEDLRISALAARSSELQEELVELGISAQRTQHPELQALWPSVLELLRSLNDRRRPTPLGDPTTE